MIAGRRKLRRKCISTTPIVIGTSFISAWDISEVNIARQPMLQGKYSNEVASFAYGHRNKAMILKEQHACGCKFKQSLTNDYFGRKLTFIRKGAMYTI
jgi:hypothetical protein